MEILKKVEIQIVNNNGLPENISEIAIRIHVFARKQNDYLLGPYFSNDEGIIEISKEEIEYEIQATLDSGLMDYFPIEDALTMAKIYPYSSMEIEKMIKTRKNSWRMLLKGEDKRWKTIRELINKLENSKK